MSNIPRKNILIGFIALLILVISFSSCSKKTDPRTIAIKINDYKMTAGEFESLFAELKMEDTPQAREAFLDNLLTRKLLLQEAQNEGLDRGKDFLKEVENFWEQSLLKVIIDKKMNELSKEIRVSEDEIKEYYDVWSKENPQDLKPIDDIKDFIRWQIVKKKQDAALDKWIAELKAKTNIKVDRKPIGLN